MSAAWALDLGTTNTLLARWDAVNDRPEVLTLSALSRRPAAPSAERARGVPSAVHALDAPGLLARLGQTPLLASRLFLGTLAHVGQPALELNQLQPKRNFVPTFKRALSRDPLLPLARAGGRTLTARDIAFLYLRELLAEATRETGERPRELVVTTPVDAYEQYRAELVQLGKRLGIHTVRFLDEPVAAALGYGLGLRQSRVVLVVDFGGGTLHLALVRLSAENTQAGNAEVLAKVSRDVGGTLVDRWVFEEFCRRFAWPVDDDGNDEVRLWHRLMLAEACRVKEAVYFEERSTFAVSVPESRQRFEQRLAGEAPSLELTRDGLIEVLTRNGLYTLLERALDELLQHAGNASAIDDVLMVGGSTLLPNVYGVFEKRFGRERVRAWQPFEAVANGAAVFASGRALPADFIVHDYALLTHDVATGAPQYALVVPRRTRFPTPEHFWRRQLVPTCGLGEPERVFKLVLCEIGSGAGPDGVVWDADGRVHRVKDTAPQQVVVKLNEANPGIGFLDPPHQPSDRTPRLDVSLGVNSERWLCATVTDLKTRKVLMRGEPVVRLL